MVSRIDQGMPIMFAWSKLQRITPPPWIWDAPKILDNMSLGNKAEHPLAKEQILYM